MISGYTGGTFPYPTFENRKDHKEAIRVVFDPSVISYDELLEHFLERAGLPGAVRCDVLFCPTIFYHGNAQRVTATNLARIVARARRNSAPVVVPAGDFFQAEEYHQRFIRKMRDSETTVGSSL